MKFGIPYLVEHDTVEEACAMCRSLQLDFVELNSNFPMCQVDRMPAEELLRMKEKYGIDLTLHIEEDCDPFSFQPRIRQAWLASVQASLQLAKAAGMLKINMHMPRGVYMTLPTKRVYMYERYRTEYWAALAVFRDMCEDELQGSHVRVAVENTGGFLPHEQEAIAYLLESPAFGLTLDIGHLQCAGESDWPFYQQHEDQLIHMHAHDAVGKKDHQAFGEGDVDLRKRLALAKQHDATVLVEVKTADALRRSVQRMNEWL